MYKLLFLCFIVLERSINTYQITYILLLASLTLCQRREGAREQEKEGWEREEEEKEKEKEREYRQENKILISTSESENRKYFRLVRKYLEAGHP